MVQTGEILEMVRVLLSGIKGGMDRDDHPACNRVRNIFLGRCLVSFDIGYPDRIRSVVHHDCDSVRSPVFPVRGVSELVAEETGRKASKEVTCDILEA